MGVFPTAGLYGVLSGQADLSHILFCRFSMKYPDNSVCPLSQVVLQKAQTTTKWKKLAT